MERLEGEIVSSHPSQHGTEFAVSTDFSMSTEDRRPKNMNSIEELEYEENDKGNPRTWKTWWRVFCSLGAILSAFSVFANAVYIATIPETALKFGLSTTASISPISVYALGLGLGPIISSASSELYGRRPIYLISVPLCLVFTVVGGSAQNFATLITMRLLAAIAGSPCITVTGGFLSDIWDVQEEKLGTLIIVLFSSSLVWAPELSPTIGEAIVRAHDWRWTFWLSAILLGISILLILPIPETFKPRILENRLRKTNHDIRKKDIWAVLKIAIGRPMHMLITEPLVWPTSLAAAVAQAVVFCFFIAYPLIFQKVYAFSQYEVGLAFLPIFVGSLFGLGIVVYFNKTRYQKEKALATAENRPISPEARLYPAMVGSILMPLSLFWLAWTARPSVPWPAPLMSGIPFGISFLTVMLAPPVYKNDVYRSEFGASALAADNFLRYMFAAVTPLFTVQMINRLGFVWAVSLLAFITVALVPVPFLTYRYGPKLRARSVYVP